MKLLITFIFVMSGLIVNGQEVMMNGKSYEVKKGVIYLDGLDVTSTLTIEEQNAIHARFQELSENLRIKEELEKNAKKAEKAQKKTEKKLKKAEKELKKKEKAQEDYDKSAKKLKQAQEKYEKLKRKGKLSPEDEAKWLKKIENHTESFNKAKKRLKRS